MKLFTGPSQPLSPLKLDKIEPIGIGVLPGDPLAPKPPRLRNDFRQVEHPDRGRERLEGQGEDLPAVRSEVSPFRVKGDAFMPHHPAGVSRVLIEQESAFPNAGQTERHATGLDRDVHHDRASRRGRCPRLDFGYRLSRRKQVGHERMMPRPPGGVKCPGGDAISPLTPLPRKTQIGPWNKVPRINPA
jgi:hypothetical protein